MSLATKAEPVEDTEPSTAQPLLPGFTPGEDSRRDSPATNQGSSMSPERTHSFHHSGRGSSPGAQSFLKSMTSGPGIGAAGKTEPSSAASLPGLSARLVGAAPGSPPVARIVLAWAGAPDRVRLVVDRVGSLGGLAAEAPQAAGDACPASGCALALVSSSAHARGVLPVQPVESCPSARPRTDRLTLVAWTDTGPRRPRVWAVSVPGLGRWLDHHVCN